MSLLDEWRFAVSARSIDELTWIAVAIFAVGLLAWWAWQRWCGRSVVLPTPFADFETRQVEVGDWKFRYHQSGQGPHLVLLHGIGANLFCWRWVLPLLNQKFTVTAVDLPGFGQSAGPSGVRYGLDEQTERLGEFFKRLEMNEMCIAGNSMGGNIALWFALEHPTVVKGLALLAPATSPRLIPLSLQRWLWLSYPVSLVLTRPAMRWAHGRTVSKPQLIEADRVEETFRTYAGKGEAVRSFMQATEAIRDSRLQNRMHEISTPVLILWGSCDRLVSRQVIDELETALVAAESHVHIGAGHHLQEDEPEWVAEKLLSFFTA